MPKPAPSSVDFDVSCCRFHLFKKKRERWKQQYETSKSTEEGTGLGTERSIDEL